MSGLWTLGLAVGCLAVLAARPALASGAWAQSEAVVCAVLAGAALCLAGHASAALRGCGGEAWRSPLVFLPLALAAWSAVTAPMALFPGTALLGAPQNGLGAVWFLAQASFTATALELRARGRLLDLAALAGAAATAIAALCNLRHLPWLQPLLARHDLLVDVPVFGFNEHLAYPALGLAAFGAARWADGRRGLAGALLGVAAVALVVSRNRTAMAAAGAAAGVVALLPVLAPLARRWFSPGRRAVFLLAAASVAAAALSPLLVIRFADLSQAPFSLLSRQILVKVLEPSLFDSPWAVVFGHGWGHYQEYLARNVGGIGIDLVTPSWVDLNRDEFHSHNALLETYFSAGLPAVLLMLGGSAAVVAAARRPALAWAFVLAWTAVDSMWFALPSSLAIQALAVAALADDRRGVRPPFPRYRAAVPLLAAAVALGGSALWLRLQSQGLEALRACLASPAPAAACPRPWVPADPRGSDLGLAALMIEGREHGSDLPALAEEASRRCRAGCALQLSIVLIDRQAAKAFATPPAADFSPPAWREEAERVLVRAPGRLDLQAPYLNWLVTAGDDATLRAMVERAGRADPGHPVVSWFGGVLRLGGGDQRAALASMRTALDDGLERYMPVPETLKTLLKESPP